MALWRVDIYWFDDDSHDTDVEADTIQEAAAKVYSQWGPTGWTHASVSGGGRTLSIDLEAREPNFIDV